MAWKEFLLGIAATLSAEFLLTGIGFAVAILKSERVTVRLLGEKAP